MAYSTENPPAKIAEAVNGAGSLWMYKDGDAIAAVDAAGYFSNAGDLGMEVGDFVFIIDTTNNLSSLGHVSAISSGAATVVALTAFP